MQMVMQVILFFAAAVNTDMNKLRADFKAAAADEKICNQWYNYFEKYTGKDALMLAYKGGFKAMKAKYSSNPFKKTGYVKDAMKVFEEAVKLNGTNPEIRYLRLAVQVKTPAFLNMSGNVEEDKKILIGKFEEFVKEVGKERGKEAYNFLVENNQITPAQKEQLKKWIH